MGEEARSNAGEVPMTPTSGGTEDVAAVVVVVAVAMAAMVDTSEDVGVTVDRTLGVSTDWSDCTG